MTADARAHFGAVIPNRQRSVRASMVRQIASLRSPQSEMAPSAASTPNAAISAPIRIRSPALPPQRIACPRIPWVLIATIGQRLTAAMIFPRRHLAARYFGGMSAWSGPGNGTYFTRSRRLRLLRRRRRHDFARRGAKSSRDAIDGRPRLLLGGRRLRHPPSCRSRYRAVMRPGSLRHSGDFRKTPDRRPLDLAVLQRAGHRHLVGRAASRIRSRGQ